MDLGEMIELMKEEVMLGSDFSQIDFLFDNTAMALAELYFQWKDNGKLDYDHEEAMPIIIWIRRAALCDILKKLWNCIPVMIRNSTPNRTWRN